MISTSSTSLLFHFLKWFSRTLREFLCCQNFKNLTSHFCDSHHRGPLNMSGFNFFSALRILSALRSGFAFFEWHAPATVQDPGVRSYLMETSSAGVWDTINCTSAPTWVDVPLNMQESNIYEKLMNFFASRARSSNSLIKNYLQLSRDEKCPCSHCLL